MLGVLFSPSLPSSLETGSFIEPGVKPAATQPWRSSCLYVCVAERGLSMCGAEARGVGVCLQQEAEAAVRGPVWVLSSEVGSSARQCTLLIAEPFPTQDL